MPIPVITGHYSTQVILKGKTGRPEDVYVNTFYFRDDSSVGTPEQVADTLADHLFEFYNDVPVGGTTPVSVASRLSSATLEDELEIRVYDLGVASPRYPMTRLRTLTGMTSTALPSEVACCLSYVAEQNQPRQRGRVYIGPLGSNALVSTDGRATVSPQFAESLARSYLRLLLKPDHQPVLWSPTDGVTKAITGGWVDNSFDTQRRRGEIASQRWTVGLFDGMKGTHLT